MTKQTFNRNILLGALPAAALASALSASPANAQATVCIGSVCESSNSGSISTGPTSVYSNGRDTYVNGRRIDPRNPRPLTNPNWQAPIEQRPITQRPSQQYTPQINPYDPRFSSAAAVPVTCNVNINLTATFGRETYDVSFPRFTFASVQDFLNAKQKLVQYGYLASQHAAVPTCGPVAVKALTEFLKRNPDRMSVTKTNTGLPAKGSDFSLELSF